MCKSMECTDEAVTEMRGDWQFTPKWDGIRCMAIIDGPDVTLINRNGVDITFRYPEVVAALGALGEHCVLDGEVIVCDPDSGTPMFKWAHQRDSFGTGRARDIERWATTHPATFIAFDIMADGRNIHDGSWCDCRANPLSWRAPRLETLRVAGNGRFQITPMTSDGISMLATVRANTLEGFVAKRMDSKYIGNRSAAWLKSKPMQSVSALVVGWTPGKGKREEWFGALTLVLIDAEGKHVDIGEVGTGFDTNDLNLLDPLVKAGVQMVVEVRYQEVQPGTGKLRFPSYQGVRHDLTETDCTIDQLTR
jgi:bifunctional non-homologous end joining protein LigD